MKPYFGKSDDTVFINWIDDEEDDHRFGLYIDSKQAYWNFVYKDMLKKKHELTDLCGYLDKEILKNLYDKIGILLGKK